MVDAEVALSGYVMFRKDRQERKGCGVSMHIEHSIRTYEIQMKKEAIWCNIVVLSYDKRMM